MSQLIYEPLPVRIPTVADAAEILRARPAADIPGLWYAPGYPELTTNQLLYAAQTVGRDSSISVSIAPAL